LFVSHKGILELFLRNANFFVAKPCVKQYHYLHHARDAMTTPDENTTDEPISRTRIAFDLAAVLTSEELEKFQAAADEAQAPNLTEHFLNLTLRVQSGTAA